MDDNKENPWLKPQSYNTAESYAFLAIAWEFKRFNDFLEKTQLEVVLKDE